MDDYDDLSSEEDDLSSVEHVNDFSSSEDPHCSNSSSYAEYCKVEKALALNRLCHEKYRRLEAILQEKKLEAERRLHELRNPVDMERFDRDNFRYVNCGKPYFKDKQGFPAPDNEDTLLMNKSEMYNCSGIASVPGWTVKDKCMLTELVHKMSKELRKKELNMQISNLVRENKSLKSTKNDKTIMELKKEISNVDKLPLKLLALPINEEYDWDFIANKLSERHSAQEYRSLWKLFLHPSINKNTWTRSEHASLQKIAFEKNLQDWDAIAQELGTGRTNYQCFVYFRTNMNNTFTSQKWTREEEEYLKRLIEYYKEDNYIPWGKVAAAMENRTKVQIYNKFHRLSELRKGKFLVEEDSVILTCVQHFGPNFRKVAEYLHGRSVTQCRDRYHVLMKQRFSAVWTADEDRKLIQLVATQDVSTNFSTVSKYFPGKDRVNIRSRYMTLSKWMRKNPNINIANAPRRGARRLGHGKSSEDLNRAIENLTKRLQTEVSDKKKTKITKDSPEEVIDEAIVAFLTTERIRYTEAAKIQSFQEELDTYAVPDGEIKNCDIKQLHKILLLLKAKLNRNKFANSPARNTYQGLLDEGVGPAAKQFRSYSKQKDKSSVSTQKNPDIWGHETLQHLNYVLPPHYATITGCKKLMSYYVSPKTLTEDMKSLNVVIKRNSMLKAQVDILMERFNSLFLWPMLLSNTTPEECKTEPKDYISLDKCIHENDSFVKSCNSILPLPDVKSTKLSQIGNEDTIDLEKCDDNQKIPVDESYFHSLPQIIND